MKRMCCLMLMALAVTVAHAADAPGVDGTWQGQLMTLHLVLHLKTASDGMLSATLDSPDQGARDIAADRASLSGDTLRLTFPTIRGAYVARFNAARDSLDGLWSQGTGAMPLRLHRDESAYSPPRPQNPVAPYPYDADTVRFAGGAKGVSLAGTFTHPRGAGPWPAVLLISGSGPEDRNEEVFGHKPFWVIADHLSRNGIAVLRVDDRGVAASSGDHARATTLDFEGDAAAGVAWLRAQKGVDSRHIGLVGHSEGGLIATLAAAKDPQIAFLVLLASMGVPGDSVLVSQSAAIIHAMGGDSAAIAQNQNTQRRMFAVMRSKLPEEAVSTQLESIVRERYDALPAAQRPDSATLNQMVRNEARQSASPWLRMLITLDPRVSLAKVKCPVLAMNGTLDLQVLPDVNLPGIEAALARAGNQDVTVKRMDGLNHLFQHAHSGSIAEYASIQETFSPEALDLMTQWIRSKAGLE